jgi:uncharacterized phiE125 gp8 family phage protein
MALKLITAATTPLVTLTEAKRHVRAVDFDDDDSYLEALIEVAASHIDAPSGWLGRAIRQSQWQLRLDSFPWEEIRIPLPPLVSIDEIEYVDIDGATQTYTGFREYGVGAANGMGSVLYEYDDEWPDTLDDEPEVVRVTFTAGYTAVPAPIKHAALLLIGDWYKNRENTSEIKMTDMPRAVDALLYPYRIY